MPSSYRLITKIRETAVRLENSQHQVEMDDKFKDTDEALVLSSATLDALREFYADRDASEKLFEDLKAAAPDKASNSTLTMDAFAEDWNKSQFWYSQETATVLAKQLLANSSSQTTVAVISAPSVFIQLKNLLASGKQTENPKIYLLEFDERFSVFPEFVRYDFQEPLKLPSSLKGAIDHIICDPPFLNEDCQTKAALTVRWLSRCWGLNRIASSSLNRDSAVISPSRLIICTGERMESLVSKLYRTQGVATTDFLPVHAKGLSNEFYCYANFQCGDWKWKR